MVDSKVPVIAGIVVGAGMIILFGMFFVPAMTNPDVERTWVSYEPTQCSTAPWISNWNKLHPKQDFQSLAEEEQYQVIKDYYKEVGIPVFDVKYRMSISPNCLACGCSAGYIIDFQVNDSNVDELRENILKSTVQMDEMVTVIIPRALESEHPNFDPEVIKVVIGVNNTVRWVNQDSIGSSVVANDESDPDFYGATSDDEEGRPKAWLDPGETFEFTFTTPGEFGYHSVPHPWKHGTVIVLPESEK